MSPVGSPHLTLVCFCSFANKISPTAAYCTSASGHVLQRTRVSVMHSTIHLITLRIFPDLICCPCVICFFCVDQAESSWQNCVEWIMRLASLQPPDRCNRSKGEFRTKHPSINRGNPQLFLWQSHLLIAEHHLSYTNVHAAHNEV